MSTATPLKTHGASRYIDHTMLSQSKKKVPSKKKKYGLSSQAYCVFMRERSVGKMDFVLVFKIMEQIMLIVLKLGRGGDQIFKSIHVNIVYTECC